MRTKKTSDGRSKLIRYAAFLRGINVVGSNILPMSELRLLCDQLGFTDVSTYIQSGNVIFKSGSSESTLIRKLEQGLKGKLNKRIRVIVRNVNELRRILTRNPFPKANPSQVGIMLFAKPLPRDFSVGITTVGQEKVFLTRREAYIHYPDGIGRSKLKLPKYAEEGTVRNVNTIRKILEIASK